jgi:hypothetical protein
MVRKSGLAIALLLVGFGLVWLVRSNAAPGEIEETTKSTGSLPIAWKLVDPKKPKEQSRDAYRFEVGVKSGDTVQHVVAEEQGQTEETMVTSGRPYSSGACGISIRPVATPSVSELRDLKIVKGVLHATYKERKSKTYFIQNLSTSDHTFLVDHVTGPDWTLLDAGGKEQTGPAVKRFQIEVKSKQTGQQEVVEERVAQEKSVLIGLLDSDWLRDVVTKSAVDPKVKTALEQVLQKVSKSREAQQALKETKEALKVLSDDQARVRENLKIVPQTSEAHKDFLQKFVAQERQIEESQKNIRAMEAGLQEQQKECEAFVAGLTVP